MLKNIREVYRLSQDYEIPTEDILLIALNASGLDTMLPYKRVRFKLSLNSKPREVFYLGIPKLKEDNTPFYLSLEKNSLLFDGEVIGKVFETENDTCDTTYFRRNDTVLVLNSNSRSSCAGCAFCATYFQDATDKSTLDSIELLSAYVNELFSNPQKYGNTRPHFHKTYPSVKNLDFSYLYQIAIITGCFNSEKKAVDHVRMLNRYFSNQGFKGELFYLGSEITSKEALKLLKEEIQSFALCLSLECFTNREKFLKNIKAQVTLQDARNVLETAKKLGISANFTYIVGLDSYEDVRNGLNEFIPLVSRFPIFQVFQPHFSGQKDLRNSEANNMEYYLKIRKEIESQFSQSIVRPRGWENYRPLWYFSFDHEHLDDIRI